MPDSPLEALRALRQALARFAPEVFSGEDCATLAEELGRTEKACAAARARAAARVAEAGAHRRRGYGNAVDWVARTGGSSAGQARAVLDTAGGPSPTASAGEPAGPTATSPAPPMPPTPW